MEHGRRSLGRDDAAAMLTVVTWLWGDKFGSGDVAKLHAAVQRNLRYEHRFLCVTDRPTDDMPCLTAEIPDPGLTKVKGCFARLRMFDPDWQTANYIDDRVVCIDLDTVITGSLEGLFNRAEPFVIMQGGNASNPCPYNGALQMLQCGAHPEVWGDFSLKAARATPFFEFPDDQGWLAAKVPGAAGWKCGAESGVYVFHKPGWPGWDERKNSTFIDALPKGARLVTFSGWRSPKRFAHLDWVASNWK